MSLDNRAVDFFPEALDPDAEEGGVTWKIHEAYDQSKSAVDLRNKEAWIPRARTRAAEQIRFHEMAHVEHTRPHEHESDWLMMLCKMLEEYRVDFLLSQQGLPVHHRHDDYNMEFLTARAPRDVFPVALEWLQFRYMVDDPTIEPDVMNHFILMHKRLPVVTQEKLNEAVLAIAGDPTDECREREAKKLLQHFQPPPPKKDETPAPLKPEVEQEIQRQIAEEYKEQEEERKEAGKPKKQGKPLDPEEIRKLQQERRASEEDLGADKPGGTGCQFLVGKMEVHDHTARSMYKTMPVKAPFTQTGKGITPEFMDRYCIDQRIFRKEHRGGVLLLDCSGSMRPDWDMITRQMAEFPNLVVATYQGVDDKVWTSGGRKPSVRGQTVTGRLCIYSKGGRIDPLFGPEPGQNGGNYVDLEALTYMSKYRGPRIWVSDGKACGGAYDTDGTSYSNYDGNLQGLIREVMKKNHWVRIRMVEDAYDYLTNRRPVRYHLVGLTSPAKPHETRFGRRS